MTKLKSVRVNIPVPFDGAATLTLTHTKGSIVYDEDSGVIFATPDRVGTLARRVGIPLANVVYFEELDESVLTAQKASEKKAKEAPPVVKPVVSDVIKLTKDSK